jgi:hypothetical protein
MLLPVVPGTLPSLTVKSKKSALAALGVKATTAIPAVITRLRKSFRLVFCIFSDS